MSRRFTLALAIALLASLLPPTAARAQSDQFCFETTGHCISGRIREFWAQNDGLRVFGLPITPPQEEEIEGRRVQVQWFERNRLELHPENARPYDVLIGRLGADRLAQEGRQWESFPKAQPQPDCRFFAETGHNACGAVLRAWRSLGVELDGRAGTSEAESLALFGLPLSGPRTETLSDGREYVVQWFERGRFELHTIFAPPNDVLLGLLGAEALGARRRSPAPDSAVRFTPSDGSEGILFESNRAVNTALFPGASPYEISYLVTMYPNGAQQGPLTRNHTFKDEGPQLSPDGRRIAFYSPRAGGLPDVYTIERDGANLTQLTDAPASDGYPAWSPDGSRIAFASERDGNWEIYVMSADGGGQTNLSRSPNSTDWAPAWSPDGRSIVFESTTFGRDSEIVVMRADGGGKANISNSPGSAEANPAWSPDGRLIAFESTRSGDREIFIMGPDGSNPRNLTRRPGNDLQPAWSPDGARLAFESDRDGNREIYLMMSDGSGQTNVTNNLADDRNPSWSRRPPEPADPCADVPDPIYARVAPAKCISSNQGLQIYVYSFLASSRFEFRVTSDGGAPPPGTANGVVDARGEKVDIGFAPGAIPPGRWRIQFVFFEPETGLQFYGATVFLRVTP
jgi:dipeptidyl aminopeptidase/acylaminoacyl peptidase